MLDIIGLCALVLMIVLGLIMIIAPKFLIQADKRDDPKAVSMTRKAGVAFIGFAAYAAIKILRYKLI